MGIVQRDGLKITIISYLGVVIGFLNKLLLFTNFLTTTQVGLTNVLFDISLLFAQLSALGTSSIAIRFFPFFKNREKRHNGFVPYMLFLCSVGFLFFTLILIIFKQPIGNLFIERSPLLVDYYFYLIPLILALVIYNFFDTYLRSLLRTVVSTFSWEIGLRLVTTAGVSLYALKIIDFRQFVILYIASHALAALIVLLYTAAIKELFIIPEKSILIKRMSGIIALYGFFSILGGISAVVVGKLDAIMLTGMLGLEKVGVYSTLVVMTSLILIPYRSIVKITGPIIADFWKKRDIVKIGSLYKKVTINTLIIGSYIFLVLWVNLDNFFEIIPKEYSIGKYIFLFVAIGRLFDVITGINGAILQTSKKYKYDILFSVILIVLTVVFNLLFIPVFDMEGAAFATMSTLVIYNLARIIFVYKVYKIQPFTWPCLYALALFLIPLGISYLLGKMGNFITDALIRSIIITAVFGALTYFFKLSDDINSTINSYLAIIKAKLPGRKIGK